MSEKDENVREQEAFETEDESAETSTISEPEDSGNQSEDTAETAEEDSDEQKEASEDEEDSGLFKKKKEKKDKKDEQIEELSDRVKRQMAEFENFRKRSEKEKTQMYEVGARSVVEKILPVVDSFERGLAGVEESNPFVEGMQMIYKQLMISLGEAGVAPIEAVGQEFDPEYHNAVMHVEDEAYGENEVVEELQKGYMYRETVVRHSMVKVAN